MKRLVMLYLSVIVLALTGSKSVSAQGQVGAPGIQQFRPKEIKLDRNYDGIIDRVESYDKKGRIIKIEADSTNDGKINEWVYYKDGTPARAEKDINGDGKPDTWIDY